MEDKYKGQVDQNGIIYRDTSVTRSTVTPLGTMVRVLMVCGGSITSSYQIGRHPEESQRYSTTFF